MLKRVLWWGAVLWGLVALIEIGLMSTTTLPLLLRVAVHLVFAVGVLGLVAGQGALFSIGAVAAALGHLSQISPPLRIYREYDPVLRDAVVESSIAQYGYGLLFGGLVLIGLGARRPGVPGWVAPAITVGAAFAGIAHYLAWPLWLSSVFVLMLVGGLAHFVALDSRSEKLARPQSVQPLSRGA